MLFALVSRIRIKFRNTQQIVRLLLCARSVRWMRWIIRIGRVYCAVNNSWISVIRGSSSFEELDKISRFVRSIRVLSARFMASIRWSLTMLLQMRSREVAIWLSSWSIEEHPVWQCLQVCELSHYTPRCSSLAGGKSLSEFAHLYAF